MAPDEGEEVLHRSPLLNGPDLTEGSCTQSSHLLADFLSSGHSLHPDTETTEKPQPHELMTLPQEERGAI